MNFNIDPQQWVHWLQEVQENPQNHKVIAKNNNSFEFIDNNIKNLWTKHILNSKEILKISTSLLERHDVSIFNKNKILSSVNYIIDRRQEKFDNLGFVFKFFAKFSQTDVHIQHDKAVVEQLQMKIDSDEKQFVKQKIHDLNEKSNDLSAENLNEEIFQCANILYDLTKHLPKDPEIADLEKQLYKLNVNNIPRIKSLVKTLGPDVIKSTLKETISSLYDRLKVEPEDLDRDCQLFHCDSLEMQTIYVQQLIKALRIGISFSTVTKIERKWKEMHSVNEMKVEEMQINTHHIVFIPGQEGGIYLKEKFLDKGSFKAAFLATSFLDIKKARSRGEVVILQPLDAVKNQFEVDKQKNQPAPPKIPLSTQEEETGSVIIRAIEEPVSNLTEEETGSVVIRKITDLPAKEEASPASFSEEGTGTVIIRKIESPVEKDNKNKIEEESPIQNSPLKKIDQDEAIKSQKDEEQIAYKKEAAMCLELRNVPGIWLTHKVADINGNIAILQTAAGYLVETKDGKKEKAINLEKWSPLLNNKQLTVKDQIIFINLIGDFLKGLQNLHQRGIIHRDLKPENILCSKNGLGGITDFGAACRDKIANEKGDLVHDPEKQTFIGSNYFIAPEISAWGRDKEKWKEIDTKADIWSAGMVLWKLLSGFEIYEHPAIRYPSPYAYLNVKELLKPTNHDFYTQAFPKPVDEDSFLYMIWSCARPYPDQRIDIDTLVKKYDQWKTRVEDQLIKGEITSIHDIRNVN